ncbi:hypothetical protein ABZ805_01685 [Saccharopolyspora sp. NPDC047091]|uniref:hypothetical protein n=1 Tax=Saccharopolyspora sp. NPDC047091 TaxID=3155924 RepID=UPI0033EE8EE6
MRGEHADPAGTGSADESRTTGAGRDRMAEEFRLLLDAAAGRAEEYLRGLGGAEHAAHASTGDPRTGDPRTGDPRTGGAGTGDAGIGDRRTGAGRTEPGTGDRATTGADRGGPTCGWCPICAIASLLRGERPELTSRLADQLAGLLDLLRESAAEHHPAGTANPPPEPAAPEPSKVQRIDVRRVRGRTAAQAAGGGAEC